MEMGHRTCPTAWTCRVSEASKRRQRNHKQGSGTCQENIEAAYEGKNGKKRGRKSRKTEDSLVYDVEPNDRCHTLSKAD
jgi:hypothetical protein